MQHRSAPENIKSGNRQNPPPDDSATPVTNSIRKGNSAVSRTTAKASIVSGQNSAESETLATDPGHDTAFNPSEQSGEQSGRIPLSKPDSDAEYGGVRGPEPTRYGDWEKNGRCVDF